jgi:predicted nucleic acid-binding protein
MIEGPDIYFDADTLITFICVNQEDLLFKLLGKKICIPNQVFNELSIDTLTSTVIDKLIKAKKIRKVSLEIGEETELYCSLRYERKGRKRIGDGEAACLVLARTRSGYLASSNYADIAPYVKDFGLENYSAARLLAFCQENTILTQDECCRIYLDFLARGRKMPFENYDQYYTNEFIPQEKK